MEQDQNSAEKKQTINIVSHPQLQEQKSPLNSEADMLNQSLALSQLSRSPEKLTPEEKAKLFSVG